MTTLLTQFAQAAPLFAQADPVGPRGYTISWFLILFCVILGLLIALRPAKRDDRVRKAPD